MAWYWELPFVKRQVVVESSFFKKVKGKYSSILNGGHYEQDDFPDELQVRTKHETLSCFIRVTGNVFLACEGFRDAVEDLEPGVHRFFPVALRKRNGEPAERRYFILNIHRQFDAVLLRHSDCTWKWIGGKRRNPRETKHFSPKMGTRLGISRPAITGCHLWQGGRMGFGFSFISDELYERMQACRPLGIDLCHCEEYDEPWVEAENIDLGIEPTLLQRLTGLLPGRA